LFSIVVVFLDSDPQPSARFIMADSVGFAIKVEKILEDGQSSCLLGVDRDGRRQKVVLYAAASVVLDAKLLVGGVYHFDPAPLQRGNSAFF
jgi:hypothetical protein